MVDVETGEPADSLPIYHDIIRFFPQTKDRIYEVCAPLYDQGLSLREIERQTGFAKTSIGETLRSRGLPLRRAKPIRKNQTASPKGMRSGVVPYGYAYLEGQLVVDPNQYKVVLRMVKLWHSGKSFIAIAKDLNDQKIPTRMGKRWTHSVVARIVRRSLEEIKPTKEKKYGTR